MWLPDMAVERGSTTFQGEYDFRLLADSEGVEVEEAPAIVQWRSFLPMMAEHPIFGVGYGGFGQFFKDGGYYPVAKSAHSSVIEVGVELGLVGLVLYTWILVAAYRGGSRVFRMPGHPSTAHLASDYWLLRSVYSCSTSLARASAVATSCASTGFSRELP